MAVSSLHIEPSLLLEPLDALESKDRDDAVAEGGKCSISLGSRSVTKTILGSFGTVIEALLNGNSI
jgi:hypothetical protein